ncbi:DUF397 domain-containing protein [Streptomyces sp. SID12501]|uniref:DUF397 domain-containing protein n=1 Tax=Streptomyces sp. SID12501 TaxID=2706042 RepID=A0A6B3BE10_9ACTN|nr:DUF397 domain-containing protein [Streptomyces sp. SID12501]NEC84677.1 DUF397 domain-containing protein [Streptomyces sp. SID12501]
MKPTTQPASAPLEWVKSSYSGNNGNCVEIAALPGGSRALRDSKNPSGPVLTFSGAEFAEFIAGAGAGIGEFGQA